MLHNRWKPRLADMRDAVANILSFSEHLQSSEDFQADKKTFDACIRNFQILGDASKHVPTSIKKKYPQVPWNNIRGMRNILIHEYFGASAGIVWKTIQDDLPKLYDNLMKINEELNQPAHPWKICPIGEYFVRSSDVDAHMREGYPVKEHLRHEHCREYSKETVNILTANEAQMIYQLYFKNIFKDKKLVDLDFKTKGSKYDSLIAGWVKYWNDIFKPETPLDPDVFKALIASESSFNPEVGKTGRGSAKGLSQLMPLTIKALQGYRNELTDHFVILDGSDVYDPGLNIAAGVRWLFQKRITATHRLKRPATWIEAVEEYKDVLRRRIKNPNKEQNAIKTFNKYLKLIPEKK